MSDRLYITPQSNMANRKDLNGYKEIHITQLAGHLKHDTIPKHDVKY